MKNIFVSFGNFLVMVEMKLKFIGKRVQLCCFSHSLSGGELLIKIFI